MFKMRTEQKNLRQFNQNYLIPFQKRRKRRSWPFLIELYPSLVLLKILRSSTDLAETATYSLARCLVQTKNKS